MACGRRSATSLRGQRTSTVPDLAYMVSHMQGVKPQARGYLVPPAAGGADTEPHDVEGLRVREGRRGVLRDDVRALDQPGGADDTYVAVVDRAGDAPAVDPLPVPGGEGGAVAPEARHRA